jgi:hypothetical protein
MEDLAQTKRDEAQMQQPKKEEEKKSNPEINEA